MGLAVACTDAAPGSSPSAVSPSTDTAVPDSLAPRFTRVVSGRQFSCALDTTGRPWCWGANHFGQLGIGDTLDRLVPVRVDAPQGFRELVAGESHVCGVDSLSGLHCWGDNEGYALGDSVVRLLTRPAPLATAYVRTLSAGAHFTCATDAEGIPHCWGARPHGELGDGDDTAAPTALPVDVKTTQRFDTLVSGLTHTCGLARPDSGDGTGGTAEGETARAAWCWGHGGALGDGTIQRRRVPVAVRGGQSFISLTAGESVTCGLDIERAAWCWGVDFEGQLGEGSVKVPNRFEPMRVSGPVRFRMLSAGLHRVCGLDLEGYAWCWGSNYNGGLGVGGSVSSATPLRVLGDRRYTSLAAGDYHTCAVDTDGVVWCWGQNSDARGGGALGNGTLSSSDEPVRVAGAMIPAGE